MTLYKVVKTYRDGQKVDVTKGYNYQQAKDAVQKLEHTKHEQVTYAVEAYEYEYSR